jgi:DNA ligase D-like protein (predicted 3'-phosphoesterase)
MIGQFPELTELRHLAPGTVLDGEIVVMSGGKPDIQSLLSRLQKGDRKIDFPGEVVPVTYIVFDILEKDKKSLIRLPLAERKILEQAVSEGPHVVLSVPVMARGEDYYRAAIARGLEGVMAKRLDSHYDPGMRSDAWLKIKAEKTCDCVIAGYTPGQGSRSRTFGALILGLYEYGSSPLPHSEGTARASETRSSRHSRRPAGIRLVYIGNVGTGFSDRDLLDLMDTFSSLKAGTPQFVVPGHYAPPVWLEPVLVAEVAYQEVTRDRKLRIPRFIRIRSDKRAEECTINQLVDGMIDSVPERPEKDESLTDTGNGTGTSSYSQALKHYKEKRDFTKTREPEGKSTMTGKGNYFVIHEHHARHVHYDLRLERDGVLKSWAVPKGIPEVAGKKNLAVAVEDHPLDYGHFEGTIPEGEYGAGSVIIWDNGTYDTKLWESDKIEITFHGKRLNGLYVLVPFRRAGKNEWLIFKTGS